MYFHDQTKEYIIYATIDELVESHNLGVYNTTYFTPFIQTIPWPVVRKRILSNNKPLKPINISLQGGDFLMNYHSSDFHLGHNTILKYRKGFNSIQEHDSMILDQMASLKKRDIIKIHGDFLFDGPNYDYYITQLKKMSCRIQLIMGNHDSLKLYKEDFIEMQLPFYSYKNMWMSHCPIHPDELRGRKLNIHGHLHGGLIYREYDLDGIPAHEPDPNYFNVNLDNNNNKFVPLELIQDTINSN